MTEIASIAGVRLASVAANIKPWNRDDLVLVALDPGAAVAATFTRNSFCAAPVTVAKEHLCSGGVRALLINAGNANAATGERGIADARACCAAVGRALQLPPEQVLPFSTGVIGEPLPLEKLLEAIPVAASRLAADGWSDAARAIMTTDTRPKLAQRSVTLDGETISVVGMAKGSGMIQPNMATMLAYVATDADIEPQLLQSLLRESVAASFNRITVDGDTSTNDAAVLIASGTAGPRLDKADDDNYRRLRDAIVQVHVELAQAIVRDGEGATKFVTVQVRGAASSDEAFKVAFAVGESPLVKTALYASDPNWGRLVMAVGNSGVEGLDPSRVNLFVDEVQLVAGGGLAPGYTEEAGQRVFARPEFTITVDLGRGGAAEHIWTCDLSRDYVAINAEYRS
ncbi:bifunctional glutamate N-acetyltransferase/amino-acid acetyltransferase ArgJ [Microbulbifer sp. TYP-18]|uniref:bifunctional glutamate N-acetyltransferase/amino-acid acetyltransferase ArgJ n=1 Tax=Microbulbifer sp. TYP-18 TaxID=3230024 RepID=UPI0034C649DD